MTAKSDQSGQGYASAHDMEAQLVRLAELGKAPTPGEVKRTEIKAKVITAMRTYGTLSAAAQVAGVSRATIYNWREADPVFAAEVNQWMHEGLEEEVVESMYKIATSTDPKQANAAVRAGELLLKAHNPRKYGDKLQVEQTLTVNVAVQTVDAFMERQRQAMQQLERTASPVIDADFTTVGEGEDKTG